MLKGFLWKFLYSVWAKDNINAIAGYSILILLPGDLPVFLQIAMEICILQRADNLKEIIIIPDSLPSGFSNYFMDIKNKYKINLVRLVKLKSIDRIIVNFMNKPGYNHWLQVIRGVEEIRSTHAIFHDVDLFINNYDLFENQYKACVSQQLACLGVSKVWDDWYQQQGISHLTATWGLMFDVEWFRSFKPYQHRGQENVVDGKCHIFDTTLLSQCLTSPEKIRYSDNNSDFIHFNYVIARYRIFHKSKGPFEDYGYKLLLIRLLIDTYDKSGWTYEIPTLTELVDGISDGTRRVTYIQDRTRSNYPEFRLKLQRLINSGILGKERRKILLNEISIFDEVLQKQKNIT